MFQHTVLYCTALTAVTGNDLTGLSTAFPLSNAGNIVTNLGGGMWTGLVYVTLQCDVQNWFRLQCKAEAMSERREECKNLGRAYAKPS